MSAPIEVLKVLLFYFILQVSSTAMRGCWESRKIY